MANQKQEIKSFLVKVKINVEQLAIIHDSFGMVKLEVKAMI